MSRLTLVLLPSLGTTVETLWGRCVGLLGDAVDVVAVDLPGHGGADPVAQEDVEGLAERVLARVSGRFHVAGDSLGGAVALQLAIVAPERVVSGAVLCSGARIGEPAAWHERAARARAEGTGALVDLSRERWFGPGFEERDADGAAALLAALEATDDGSYAALCEALAGFDVRTRLPEISVPLLAVGGADDVATPSELLRADAGVVTGARFVELAATGHLAPAERPDEVAGLLLGHVLAAEAGEGMRVRREVLGDAHVDRATAATTGFTHDFQRFITDYAWGGVWTRPGLGRRERSLVTLTALVARGHHDELAMHVRAALGNGLTPDEIGECLLQCAIYCGVPDANAAFRVASRALAEAGVDLDAEPPLT